MNSKLSTNELAWRNIGQICDEMYLTIHLIRRPLTKPVPQNMVLISKGVNEEIIYEYENMDIEALTRNVIRFLEKYQDDRKNRLARKGVDMI